MVGSFLFWVIEMMPFSGEKTEAAQDETTGERISHFRRRPSRESAGGDVVRKTGGNDASDSCHGQIHTLDAPLV
jgi:hypothetical protein